MLKPILFAFAAAALLAQPARWSEEKARDWYAKLPWLVGANFLPASAINELEMWQAETFDPARIDKELQWAQSIGMNTVRVYLHDLPWQQDAAGFRKRIDSFLGIAAKHKIRPVFVLFDSCWDPFPKLGPQRAPTPGVHNSGWVQSPGAEALADPSQYPRLEAYVKGVVGAFAKDKRVLAWDVWNEPENPNTRSYGTKELKNKTDLVLKLLPQVFAWARSVNPEQPLTAAPWQGDWSVHEKMTPINRLMVESSDIITFHNYAKPEEFRTRLRQMKRYNRPVICTEYMARGNGSTFEGSLPIAKEEGVGAINWGLVQGKSQTHLPWDSWDRPYTDRQPSVWFHEVFQTDGKPYRPEEVSLIRKLTGKSK